MSIVKAIINEINVDDIMSFVEPVVRAIPTQWVFAEAITPDEEKVITVTQYEGRAPNPKWLVDYPNIQVMVRLPSNQHEEGMEVCTIIRDILLGHPGIDLPDDKGRIISITAGSGITDLGRDEQDPKNRHMFSLDFRLIVEPTKTTHSNRESLLGT